MLQKKQIKIWDVNVDTIIISKLLITKTNSKYLIGIKFGKSISPLVLIMPNMSEYVRDKNNNNKIMSFCMGHEKLLEIYKANWTKIENLENIELNALPDYDDRYIKTKIRT